MQDVSRAFGNEGRGTSKDSTYVTDGCQLLPGIGLFYQTLSLGGADTMVINCKLGPHEVGSRIKKKSQ